MVTFILYVFYHNKKGESNRWRVHFPSISFILHLIVVFISVNLIGLFSHILFLIRKISACVSENV